MAAELDNINFLRPSDFLLRVDNQNFKKVDYYCQSVNLPGVSVGPVGNARVARAKIALEGDSIEVEQLSATFKVDADMLNYVKMYEWLLNQVNTPDILQRDLTLFIYNSNNVVSNQIKFINAVPVSLTPLEFDLKQPANEYLSATATFALDYYEIS